MDVEHTASERSWIACLIFPWKTKLEKVWERLSFWDAAKGTFESRCCRDLPSKSSSLILPSFHKMRRRLRQDM